MNCRITENCTLTLCKRISRVAAHEQWISHSGWCLDSWILFWYRIPSVVHVQFCCWTSWELTLVSLVLYSLWGSLLLPCIWFFPSHDSLSVLGLDYSLVPVFLKKAFDFSHRTAQRMDSTGNSWQIIVSAAPTIHSGFTAVWAFG